MTRQFHALSLSARLAALALLLAAIGLLSSSPAVLADNVADNSDFGPIPSADLQLDRGAPPVELGRAVTKPMNDRGRGSSGARDPARGSRAVDDAAPHKPASGQRPLRERLLKEIYGDEPLPTATDRQPARPAPQPPSAPQQPTVAQKIAKRYEDPKVVRVLQQLSAQSGEALYVETSQLIDNRHIEPSSYQRRVASGLEHLSLAVELPSYQRAAGLSANRQELRHFQREVAALGEQVRVQNLSQAVEVLRSAEELADQTLQLPPGAVCLAFVYGALDTLDQFSMFLAPEKSGGANLGLKEDMVGIGVEVEGHPQGLKILKAIAGGPAAAATLQRGDIITAVDGRSLAGLDLSQAVDYIAGPAGSPIRLDLRRGNLIGDVTLVRRSFKLQSVAEVRLEDDGVGYIKIESFAEATAKELDDALWKLHNEGMQSLVLDLRGNPGGLLTTAIEVSDRFLPSGTIVSTKGRTAADNSVETARHSQTWKVPLVVLIDHNSASASEIFAAAIQENGRGVIVGEKSYGKGTVQTLFPLQSVPGGLRLTTAKFYSPEGRPMAGVGVNPDIRVSGSTSENATDEALRAGLQAAKDPRVQDMAGRVRHTPRRLDERATDIPPRTIVRTTRSGGRLGSHERRAA